VTKMLINASRKLTRSKMWRRVRLRRGTVKKYISTISSYLKGEVDKLQASETTKSSRRPSIEGMTKEEDNAKNDGRYLVQQYLDSQANTAADTTHAVAASSRELVRGLSSRQVQDTQRHQQDMDRVLAKLAELEVRMAPASAPSANKKFHEGPQVTDPRSLLNVIAPGSSILAMRSNILGPMPETYV